MLVLVLALVLVLVLVLVLFTVDPSNALQHVVKQRTRSDPASSKSYADGTKRSSHVDGEKSQVTCLAHEAKVIWPIIASKLMRTRCSSV